MIGDNISKHFQENSNLFVLNFNLGPLKDLDGLIDEVLALDSAKSYLWKQVTIGRTFLKKGEKSHISQHTFGNPAPNRG